jgi:hypothetical protein
MLVAFAAAAADPSVVFEVQGGLPRGSGMPDFALYHDGTVIFRAPYGSGVPSGYVSTRLSTDQYGKLVSRIAPKALLRLSDEYDAITATDPVSNVIHVWVGGRRKTVAVIGSLWLSPPDQPNRSRAKSPPEFLRAYDAITSFAVPAEVWLPQTFEVWLSPREHFQERLLRWPASWPSLEAATAVRGKGRRVSLPGQEFATFRQLVPRDGDATTVLIEKRRWQMDYRLPFPREEAWGAPGPRWR